jgi:hypothetical protein
MPEAGSKAERDEDRLVLIDVMKHRLDLIRLIVGLEFVTRGKM